MSLSATIRRWVSSTVISQVSIPYVSTDLTHELRMLIDLFVRIGMLV